MSKSKIRVGIVGAGGVGGAWWQGQLPRRRLPAVRGG